MKYNHTSPGLGSLILSSLIEIRRETGQCNLPACVFIFMIPICLTSSSQFNLKGLYYLQNFSLEQLQQESNLGKWRERNALLNTCTRQKDKIQNMVPNFPLRLIVFMIKSSLLSLSS